MPKIDTGCVGRKNATEDLGSLFKLYCQSSSECYEDTRRKEKKSKPLLLVSTSSSIFQLIDHSAFTTIGPFLKHQFSNVALLVHEPNMRSLLVQHEKSPLIMSSRSFEHTSHMLPLDALASHIKHGTYTFSIT